MAAKGALLADRVRLNTIADRLRAGERYEDIIEDVDGVLGTALPERDEATEAEFEEQRIAVKCAVAAREREERGGS